jgi:hypothetical protein
MPDYSKAKIYAIKSDQYDKIYIGSTCRPLNIRLNEHKCRKYDVKKEKSKEILKYNDAKIYLIEDYPCSNKDELRKREGEIIRQIGSMNMKVAGRTKQNYIAENNEKHKDYHKQYQQQYRQKPEVKQYKKQYQQKPDVKEYNYEKISCICGCSISRHHISTHKKSQKHIKLIEQLNNASNNEIVV